MPKNLQSEYLRKYIEKYHASATDFAEIMFGCSLKTLLNYCKNNELGVQFSRGGYRSPERKEAFRTFCINAEERLSEEEFSDKTPTCENANVVPQKTLLEHFELTFSGNVDLTHIYNSLKMMMPVERSVSLKIVCDIR